MSRSLSLALASVLCLAGCAAPATKPTNVPSAAAAPVAATPTASGDDNLNAVAWSQRAIEHDLIYLQTYRDAQQRLLQALGDPRWDALDQADRRTPLNRAMKPAVVLDIDETVLDNSPFQARLVRSGGEYNEAAWAAWCREQAARAVPGAVEFTQFAARHGIAVIYISNRARDLDEVTVANLRKVGLPVAGEDSFLGLGTVVPGCVQSGSDKGCRRQLVAQHYRVLMQFGDQLGDFLDIATNTPAGRAQAVEPYLGWIGERWFVLPNPTYGSWEPALFNNDWHLPRPQRQQLKRDALRYN